tara:strand:+ start:396 stop:1064 length:669 start_codon:yes stop_codon:yes gene_type:complete
MTSLSSKQHIAHHRKIHPSETTHPLPLNVTNRVKIGTASGLSVAGGEQAPIADPDGREGWLFTKALADTAKFNYYFYGQGSHAIILEDITSLVADVHIDNYQTGGSLPFFTIYTKPTGVGDAGVWFHSKMVYTIDPNQHIILGEAIRLYTGSKPYPSINKLRAVSCNTTIVEGEALVSEEVLTIAIHSDSASPALTSILVSKVGIDFFSGRDKISTRTILVN